MKSQFYKKLVVTVIVLISVAMFSLYNQNLTKQPYVIDGVLDLTNWSFEEDGIVELRGQWGFQEGIQSPTSTATFDELASVPGNMPIAQNRGAGTYFVTIKLPSATKQLLAVDVEGVRMSNALIVNGEQIRAEGEPTNDASTYTPRNIPYTAQFVVQQQEVLLQVQVANFDYYQTGIHLPIYLGTAEQINKRQAIQLTFEASIFIMAFIGAFIFLVVYMTFQKDRTSLILGIYFLILGVLVVTTNQKVFLQIFPDWSFLRFVKIRDFAMYFSIPILIYYVRQLFPQVRGSWRLLQSIAAVYLVYSVALVVLPYRLLGGAGDFILLPLFNITYVILIVTMLNHYRKGNISVLNQRELEYFILFLIASTGIIYSSAMYYANIISNLWLGLLSAVLAGIYIILMFIAKFEATYLSMEDYAAKLERESRLKDEFLFRTSYELKTPLHGIVNLAQLSLDSNTRQDLSYIEKNNRLIKATANRLELIVNDLIDFSLIKENKFRVEMKEIDLLFCIHSVVEVLDYQARAKNITIHIKVSDEARYVIADEARLIQVIYNLVENSLYHTKDGTITIKSRVKQKYVHITIQDTGSGIDIVDREKIFEAYEQGGNHANTGGLGLGLTISKQLVLQMNGTLLLEWSEVGIGSTFAIYMQKAAIQPLFASWSKESSLVDTKRDHVDTKRQATILIVDDEPLNRAVLRELLQYQVKTIIEAESGEQALRLLDEGQMPDVVLLDVMLEDMTGYEICRQIREKYSLIELPVLFITVNHSIRDISQAFLVGGNDFLTKPFEAEEVRARVETLLKMKQLAKQSTENEMAFLQSQIKPHFLFNTLSAIIAFTYEDPQKTRQLLQSLSVYLRTVFQTSKQTEWTTLEMELALTEAFVAIEQQRHGERLDVSFDVDQDLLHYATPTLLLQPLVENAISHGVLKRNEGGHVLIIIEEQDDGICVIVQDNGIGISEEKMQAILAEQPVGSGIGLANVQKRVLKLTKQPLKIDSVEQEGTTISYRLPMIDYAEVEER